MKATFGRTAGMTWSVAANLLLASGPPGRVVYMNGESFMLTVAERLGEPRPSPRRGSTPRIDCGLPRERPPPGSIASGFATIPCLVDSDTEILDLKPPQVFRRSPP